MGSQLEQYLAQQKAAATQPPAQLPQNLDEAGPSVGRLPLESMSTYIPLGSRPFFQNLGVKTNRFSDLPPAIQSQLAQVAPAVEKLGDKFDYNRLAAIAEDGRQKLEPDVYFKMASVAALGQARKDMLGAKAAAGFLGVAGSEAAHQATFGLIPRVQEEEGSTLVLSPQGQSIAKLVGGVAGIALSGKLVVSALSKVTLLPGIGPSLLQIPQRVREIMLGVGTGAIMDAARPDGLPTDPAALDITARIAHPIAHFLGDSEAAQRTALGVSGGMVGGALGELLLPVFRGIRNARETYVASQIDPETMALIRTKLGESGIGVATGETNKAVVSKLLRNMDKVSQTEKLAAVTAADETRMDFILNHLYTDPAFQGTADLRYMAGVFRANPGGISVAKDVQSGGAAEALTKRMGLNVVSIKAGNDAILIRPQVVFPEVAPMGTKLKNQLSDFTDQVRAAGRGQPSTRLSILPDGVVVRGNYNAPEMTSRYKLAVPSVEGTAMHDVALREHFGMMDVQVGQGGAVTVNLPSSVTQRQVSMLGKMADRGIPEITLNSATPGLSTTLQQPFGMQVEDAMSGLIKGASKPKITSDVVAKVQQYQREGVFNGQAGVLPDGYPVEVVRKIGKKVLYKDPITQLLHRTPEENIAILPTSLEGELQPSRQIFSAMAPEEQKAFAQLRQGINEGLTQPITTPRELESFASARGKLVSVLGKGRVRIFDPNTGDSKVFDSIRSAVTNVRGTLGPMPDLTPPEVEELLGFKPNMGFVGNNGPPARFGEPIPITEDEFAKAATDKTLGMLPPGAVQQFFTPTKGLMADLSTKYGMPFDKVFDNLQSGTVHRQNFVSAWVHGEGPGLPEDVMPLTKIYKMAGKPDEGRQRLFTAWLESEGDPTTRASIEAQMKPTEIKAAGELRKWYGLGPENGLFKALDVDAAFLTDYAPHLREHTEGAGNDIVQAWRTTRGTPLPKSVQFFADFARDGTLNLYEDRAFVAAAKYVEAGARSRYLNSAMDDAKRLLRAIPDNAVKAPLVNYIEALRGSEFTSQRAAMDASFSNLLHSLGANEKLSRDVGEKLTLGLLGMSYQSTMSFRPGLAIRNAAQIFQTTWPLLGGLDDTFAEAIGRALTSAGRDAAIAAGAINVQQRAVFAGEDVTAMMPEWLQKSNNLGFKLYDSADNFTRSVSFHTAKLKTEKAIAAFGDALASGTDVATAQRALIKDSGAMILSKDFADEFLRRVATSPESAGNFLGKQMSDVTQFLYGRGNQPRWMRSVPGRFFGQFGTWPLWYMDYVKRSFMNMWSNGYPTEAMKFLGKIALTDAAIYETGRRTNLDLRRWMSGNALFGAPPFGQPPAVGALYGIAQLSRGLSESVLGTYDSPANKQRMADAKKTLEQTGSAFVPNMYAVRDIGRLLNATSPTEVAAVLLATRPSTDYTVQQRLNMLFAPGRMSTDIDLEQKGDASPTATELLLRGMQTGESKMVVPQGNLPPQPPPGAAPPAGAPSTKPSFKFKPAGVSGRPPLEPTALPPSIRSGESKPVQ